LVPFGYAVQGDLSILLHAIEIASKYVSAQVRAAGIFDLYGVEGTTNVQGYAPLYTPRSVHLRGAITDLFLPWPLCFPNRSVTTTAKW
jgi:hypothetical protein